MKKIMAVLTVLMCFASTNAFAQLKEVRGVQTRVVEYQTEYFCANRLNKKHGFEFKNENNYAVWIEAELHTQGFVYDNLMGDFVKEGTRDTKSFTLNAGETYVWKCGDRMIWDCRDYYDRYYVTYKAYKAE